MRPSASQLPFETTLSGSFHGISRSRAVQRGDDIDAERILLIDHRSSLDESFSEGLEQNGFLVDIASGDDAITNSAVAGDYALILLNSMRPGLAGLNAVQSVRRRTDAPLLVLTDRDSVAARMAGLELGASDYLVKPFSLFELLARVKVLARHPNTHRHINISLHPQPVLQLADLELNERTAKCSRDGIELGLTKREFALLLVLLRNQGRVMSRQKLARRVWNMDLDETSNAVDVAILRLRSKLDAPFEAKLLHTVRSQGYVLEQRSGS